MLRKKNGLKIERKKTELNLNEAEIVKIAGTVASQTPGSSVRDAAIQLATEAAYQAGNNTDKVIEIADKAVEVVDKTTKIINRGTALVGGTESSRALANIAFKTTKDIGRGDKVCTGLCLVSATCECLALSCSLIKVIPFRGPIYTGSKIISRGCMTWRNACAREGC